MYVHRLALGMYVCAHVDNTYSIFYACMRVCVQTYIYKPTCDIAFLLSTEAGSQMNLELT